MTWLKSKLLCTIIQTEPVIRFDLDYSMQNHLTTINPILYEYASFQLSADMKGKRVGVLKEGFEECEDDIIKIVKEATEKFTQAGAVVEEVSIPMHNNGRH